MPANAKKLNDLLPYGTFGIFHLIRFYKNISAPAFYNNKTPLMIEYAHEMPKGRAITEARTCRYTKK